MRLFQRTAALVSVATVMICAPAASWAQPETQRVNAYAAAVKDFRDRVDAYLTVHKKASDGVPPLKETSDPAKLTAREQALGEAIRQARAGAKPGDIFGAELTAHIRNVVRKDWAKRSAADKAGLTNEVPPGYLADVNATYPPKLPLGTFPASLLAALPPLPEDLEYRFIGRHLILRDVKANIIVDVLSNVLPGART
jgi:hypothetical protein